MCYQNEHNRILKEEQMKDEMRKNTQSNFHNAMLEGHEVIMNAYNRWQDAIRASVKDRHPITHEPLDGE